MSDQMYPVVIVTFEERSHSCKNRERRPRNFAVKVNTEETIEQNVHDDEEIDRNIRNIELFFNEVTNPLTVGNDRGIGKELLRKIVDLFADGIVGSKDSGRSQKRKDHNDKKIIKKEVLLENGLMNAGEVMWDINLVESPLAFGLIDLGKEKNRE